MIVPEGVISMQDNFQKEVDHLAKVLKQNGYPANFICNASAPPTQETADISSPEEEQEKGPSGGDILRGWDE